MTRRLCKRERQQILQEMITLARFLTAKGIPLPEVKAAVGQLKADLLHAYRQGITVTSVDRNAYVVQRVQEAPAEDGE